MRLLYAEAEDLLSRAVTEILEKNNYSVDAVHDGEKVLEYIEMNNHDAVILSIMMPKMDGITALKNIRRKGNLIPVLILTEKTAVEDKVLAFDCGANDYLTKPFEEQELLARIRAMTRSRMAADSILRAGNIMLNRATFELFSPAGSLRLANREFQIMELLMSNPGCVISPERILEKIWGYNCDTDINVVWVYISYLRKKLRSVQADVRIKGIRNAGYILEEI